MGFGIAVGIAIHQLIIVKKCLGSYVPKQNYKIMVPKTDAIIETKYGRYVVLENDAQLLNKIKQQN